MPAITTAKNNQNLDKSSLNTQTPNAKLTKSQPLVIPVDPDQTQFLGQIFPIQSIHQQVLTHISYMHISSQPSSNQQTLNQKNSRPAVNFCDLALLDTTDNIELIGPHTITNELITQLLQVPITLELQVYKMPSSNYSSHATQTNIKELLDLFGCKTFEICGSTAKLLLDSQSMPPLNKDIDIGMYMDMSQFSSEPEIRNQQILDRYCDHFKFPKDAALRVRCAIYPFIDHDFGCTFKPAVKQQNSNSLDLTFIDDRLYPLNHNKIQENPFPRWDSIQSCFKILCLDGKPQVQQLLSLSAIEHLNKRGILVFNPYLNQEKGLQRVQKAYMHSQRQYGPTNVRNLQPELVDYYFEAADPYSKRKFETNTKNMNPIQGFSFNELLDEHAFIRNEFEQKKLTQYDLFCLDIILSGTALRNIDKLQLTPDHDQYLNHLIYQAQCAAVCKQQPLLFKHLTQILKDPIDIKKLHPMTQIWLEALMSNPSTTKSLPGTARVNWIKYSSDSAQLSPNLLQDKLDAVIKLMDQNWSKKTLKKKNIKTVKQDLRQELIRLEDEIPACKVLVSWLKKNPGDSACFIELCKKLLRIDSDSSPEILNTLEPILLSMSFEQHKDTKTSLSMIEFCLDQERFLKSDVCSQKMHEALIHFATRANSKNEFTDFDRLLKEHIEIQQIPQSPLSDALKKISNLSELAEKIQKKSSQLEILFGLYHILGDHELENSRSITTAAFYFEKSMPYKAFTLNAGITTIECALQLGNISKAMQILLSMLSHLTNAEKENQNFRNTAHQVISSITFESYLEPKATHLTKTFFNFIELTLKNTDLKNAADHSYAQGLIHLLGHFLVDNINTITPKQSKMVNKKILELSSNLKLLTNEHHDYYFQLISRASAYAAKNHADSLIQTTAYQNKDSEIYNRVQNLYKEASVHFQGITTLTTADNIQLAEISFFKGNIDDALRLMKIASKENAELVSKGLGMLLLTLPKEKKQKAIRYFIRLIEDKIQNNQKISHSLFAQLLIAVQDRQEDIIADNPDEFDLVTKILNLLSSSLLTQDQLQSSLLSKFSNESFIEINALSWAIGIILVGFKRSKNRDVDSLKYIHKIIEINQNFDSQGKLHYLLAQKEKKQIQELEFKAKALYKFIHTQAELLATIPETVPLKSALQPTMEMSSLFKELISKSGKLTNLYPGFTENDRNYSRFISIMNSIIMSSQSFNFTPIKPSKLSSILQQFIVEIESFNQELQISPKKTYSNNELDQKISGLLGEFAIPYLHSTLDKVLVICYLTDSAVTQETLLSIHKGLDKNHLKEARQEILKYLQQMSNKLAAGKPITAEETIFINSYFKAHIIRQEFMRQFEGVLRVQANSGVNDVRATRLLSFNSKAAAKSLVKLANLAGTALEAQLKEQTLKAFQAP